jgi:hypothetical protein
MCFLPTLANRLAAATWNRNLETVGNQVVMCYLPNCLTDRYSWNITPFCPRNPVHSCMCSLPSHLYRPPLQTVDSSGYNDKSQQKQKQADKLSMTKLPEMQKMALYQHWTKTAYKHIVMMTSTLLLILYPLMDRESWSLCFRDDPMGTLLAATKRQMCLAGHISLGPEQSIVETGSPCPDQTWTKQKEDWHIKSQLMQSTNMITNMPVFSALQFFFGNKSLYLRAIFSKFISIFATLAV